MARRAVNRLPFDDRAFQYGEIYKIKDSLIVFPEAQYVKRTSHDTRLVCIIHHCKANSDPRAWVINVAPLSTKIEYKRDTDLEIYPNNENHIDKVSLIRLGCAQPVLKIDLEGPVGNLSREELLQLTGLQIMLTGVEL